MRTLKKTNKSQHDEKREPLVISRNVRKQRGLAPGRLVFVGVCLVGTPGFEPGAPIPAGTRGRSSSSGPSLALGVGRANTDKDTASRTQPIHQSLVSCVSLRVRVPSAPPIPVNPRSPSNGRRAFLRRVFRPLGSRPAIPIDERPWTWVHGQDTDNDTSKRPGLVGRNGRGSIAVSRRQPARPFSRRCPGNLLRQTTIRTVWTPAETSTSTTWGGRCGRTLMSPLRSR